MIEVSSTERCQLLDITAEVRAWLKAQGARAGVLHLWSLHTTCGLTVNEGADPDVARDIVDHLGELVPVDGHFRHREGNSDSHIKTLLSNPGLTLIVDDGAPLLGTWQRIFLAEWDGPRDRRIAARLVATP